MPEPVSEAMMGTYRIAKVHVEKAVYHFDKAFDYLVPEALHDTLRRGCRVMVPFGGGNRKRQGMVVQVVAADEVDKRTKPVWMQLDETPVFSEEMFRIADFMVRNTFCVFYDAVRTILPNAMSMNLTCRYQLVRAVDEEELVDFTYEERNLIGFLSKAKSQKEMDEYLASQQQGMKQAVAGLIEKKVIAVEDLARQKVSDKTVQAVRLTGAWLAGEIDGKRTPKQQEVISFLEQNISATAKEVMYFCGVGQGVLQTLVKHGVAEFTAQQTFRIPDQADATAEPEEVQLNPRQKQVYHGILEMLREEKPQIALLYGVTGSGKTHVFAKLIEQVVNSGKQALMLVPEISLTPQMVSRFKALFGSRVAVMHSSLSLGERLDEFKRIRSGKAGIVVGTRSAVFAPCEKIGLIIMDEEGESSYKSEASPRYHAREIAKLRCIHHNAVLLLASATPSVESWYKAEQGTYRLFSLEERYAGTPLPQVYLVDMKQEEKQANTSSVSGMLRREIAENLKRREQVILFLNRRGYQTIAQCIECGEALKCPHCDAAMTYHRDNEYMMCHYCGHAVRWERKCTHCGSGHMKLSGLGTQKVEDELRRDYPDARILRMDADTTYSRYAYTESFEAFGKGEYDILIGTQMIAKGLDFPNVTLVGVLNVDAGLYSPDYRSVERVFSLITQVVGRSGRAEKSGRAYIQTYVPENEVINFAARQDYPAFYADEISNREALLYPPFCDICTVTFSGLAPQAVSEAAQCFMQIMAQYAKGMEKEISFRALGPVQAAIYKIGGKYREKILIKCWFKYKFKEYLRICLLAAGKDKHFRNITVYADVNGDVNS